VAETMQNENQSTKMLQMPWKIISFLRRNHATNLQNSIQITPGTKPKKKSKTVKKMPKTILHPF